MFVLTFSVYLVHHIFLCFEICYLLDSFQLPLSTVCSRQLVTRFLKLSLRTYSLFPDVQVFCLETSRTRTHVFAIYHCTHDFFGIGMCHFGRTDKTMFFFYFVQISTKLYYYFGASVHKLYELSRFCLYHPMKLNLA